MKAPNDEPKQIEFIELIKAAIWQMLANPETRDAMLENIVYVGLENYVEFRELEKELEELKNKCCHSGRPLGNPESPKF